MLVSVYLAFGVLLIALVLSIGLLAWGLQNRGSGVVLAKAFGGIVLVLSILSMVCLANTVRTMMSQVPMMQKFNGPMKNMTQQNGKMQNAKSTQKNGQNR